MALLGKPCRSCMRIRVFMMCALPIVILIGLRPEGMVRLAGLVPDAGWIATAMMVVGSISFIVKYRKYKSQS